MQIKTIYMLKAEEGYVLKKGDTYTSAILLREGETSDGWSEITQEEYDEYLKSISDPDADNKPSINQKSEVTISDLEYSFIPADNTTYHFTNIKTLTFTSIPENVNKILCYLKSSVEGLTISLPKNIKLVEEIPDILPLKQYLISITDNVVVMKEIIE